MKTKSTSSNYSSGIHTTGTTPAKAAKAYSDAAVTSTPKIRDITSIMGIPEEEFTPKVREAIMTLMQEVADLRKSLDEMTKRFAAEKQLADQDPLLPVYNRRAFVRELTKAQASIERYHGTASLVYIDLNDFKLINDTYGHQAGDHVLYEFSTRLADSVRGTDIVGRLGGDEFGIILSHTDKEASSVLMGRFSKDLEMNPIVWENQPLRVTMSYGVATLSPGIDVEETMATADNQMYQEKRRSKP